MKPNRPHVVSSTTIHITVGWECCDSLILQKRAQDNIKNTEDDRRWYVLERKDRVLGWCTAYMGFKTQSEVGPLTPGDFYEFRLKAATETEDSEWSDILFAVTREDVIPVAQIHRAVENGPVMTLRKVLSQRQSAIDTPNKQGQTALGLAITRNNTSFMSILLNNGAEIGNTEIGSGRTPLMVATQRGLLEAVQLLLEKGSNWHAKDRNLMTALNYAVDNSHLAVVKLAIGEGADVRTKDKFGWTPLMRGVLLKSSLDVLRFLLENGCNANDADERGQTTLMQAVLSERPEVVELLLQKGADITPRNAYGHSAYDLARASNSETQSESETKISVREDLDKVNLGPGPKRLKGNSKGDHLRFGRT